MRPWIKSMSLISALALAGCGGGSDGDKTGDTVSDYTIAFAPVVNGAPFSCTQTYANIGTSKTTISPLDFRMYVSGVKLVRASGEEVPLQLKSDGKWQGDNIALLDFADNSGSCANATAETNTTVVGTAPKHDDYTGLVFAVGVPADQDHLTADAATAKPPLNQPSMFWGWQAGYRYLKLEVKSTKNEEWAFHLGATGCSDTAPYTCSYPNLPVIKLSGFTPGNNKVAIDLAQIYATSDLDAAAPSGMGIGCTSADTEPACPGLFTTLGLTYGSASPGATQTVFSVSK